MLFQTKLVVLGKAVPLNMPLILDRFWPIWGIEKKKLRKKIIIGLSNLKQYFYS